MKIFKKTIIRDIIANVIYSILVISYFWCFNTQVTLLDSPTIIKYINISSLTFLGIAIIMFEWAYRKDKSKLYVYGLEFLALAIFTLLIKHIPKVFGYTTKTYTEIGTYAFLGYYILKSGIQFTMEKQNQLKSLSDIKEIVKEEPTKKVTKRKNIKVEEGK